MLEFLFGREKQEKELVCAVIPAAGSSRRMGGENKLLMELGEIPVLIRTLIAFENAESIDQIIITCREEDIVPYSQLCKQFGLTKIIKIVKGGETRTHSVLSGVLQCDENIKYIAIHDGARPLITEQIIDDTVQKAMETDAAAPVVALKDSIKKVVDGKIVEDIDRASIVAVQTPQIFAKNIIREALSKAIDSNITYTDDCAAVEALGVNVSTTEGSYENIKITTPEDIIVGEALLAGREYI